MELTGPFRRDFIDLRTRAELLDLCGDALGAERLRALSLESAQEAEINCYAYQRLWRGRIEDALDLLRINVERCPASSNAWHSLGEAYEMSGDADNARECYEKAAAIAAALQSSLPDWPAAAI